MSMDNRKFISWIVSQDGETMVIVLLLVLLTTVSSLLYSFNTKYNQCNIDKLEMQMEFSKQRVIDSEKLREQHRQKIDELTQNYVDRLEEINDLKTSINKTINQTKNEINKY